MAHFSQSGRVPWPERVIDSASLEHLLLGGQHRQHILCLFKIVRHVDVPRLSGSGRLLLSGTPTPKHLTIAEAFVAVLHVLIIRVIKDGSIIILLLFDLGIRILGGKVIDPQCSSVGLSLSLLGKVNEVVDRPYLARLLDEKTIFIGVMVIPRSVDIHDCRVGLSTWVLGIAFSHVGLGSETISGNSGVVFG
jgi:hypothetical protein